MQEKTKEMLRIAQQTCDDEDRSTEYMLQYMQDFANVNLDCVLNFLQEEDKRINKELKELNEQFPFKGLK